MSLMNTESVFKYFKNLIYLGKDEEGNPNKNDLNAHEQYLIELCAEYVRRNSINDDAEWIDNKCSNCGKGIEDLIASPEWYENEKPNFCPFCGKKFKGSEVK